MVLETLARPVAKAGEAVVRILVADIVPYMGEVLNGSRPYPLSLPMTPGNTAIGRIEEVGPDSVHLKNGDLVFCDITIRARDDPSVSILFGIHGGGYPAAQKLMDGEWRHATYAEYTRFPLENLYRLNEAILLDKYKFTLSDLAMMPVCLVPFGGLSDIDLKPGELVIVAPATGRYGGAAVAVALAMGATVVAAGRNKTALKALDEVHGHTGRLKLVALNENVAQNTEMLKAAADGADAYIDFSPPAAQGSSLLTSAIGALRPFGRCVIMGGMGGNIELNYLDVMFRSLRIQGRFMYERRHIIQLIKMIESGLLSLGKKIGVHQAKEFGLESIDVALEEAAKLTGWGPHVVLKP
ncbi:hypothetical protein N7495_007563 [Penicillium taxi]|uniref:uncharacterized protein n=1 Tax=Penicillium taxi TaxID=168475 RepID=UPI0025459FE6|nr:uncharacterized protein N7495_007563 [Penicillium taxi]KAJ5887522.1 hypothetical protein N7495_007563 [Penicillium taxi]